jgi:hypothetical protein
MNARKKIRNSNLFKYIRKPISVDAVPKSPVDIASYTSTRLSRKGMCNKFPTVLIISEPPLSREKINRIKVIIHRCSRFIESVEMGHAKR